MLATQTDATLKLKLLKAKLLAAKAPHVAAHLAVAKEVKLKTVNAWAKSIEAVSIQTSRNILERKLNAKALIVYLGQSCQKGNI